MKELLAIIAGMQFSDVIDIVLVSVLFYFLFALLKETRSAVALRGLISIMILSFLGFFLAKVFNLSAVRLIFERFWIVILLVFLIVFQNEFKKALTDIGQLKVFRHFFHQSGVFLEEILKAIGIMSSRRIGALIAVERRNPLKAYADTGTAIDSAITSELVRTIFAHYTPLHDGAMIVRGDRIVAAGCILPLTNDPNLSKELGTRHRAAIGLSEETDAVVLVVSEETGSISVAVHGNLYRNQTLDSLRSQLQQLLGIESEVESAS
jgi:diadenylate cyclase